MTDNGERIFLVTCRMGNKNAEPDFHVKFAAGNWGNVVNLSGLTYAVKTSKSQNELFEELEAELHGAYELYVIQLCMPFEGHGARKTMKWLHENLEEVEPF